MVIDIELQIFHAVHQYKAEHGGLPEITINPKTYIELLQSNNLYLSFPAEGGSKNMIFGCAVTVVYNQEEDFKLKSE